MRPLYGTLDLEIVLAQKKITYQRASLLKRSLNLLIDYLVILNISKLVGVLLGIFIVALEKQSWLVVFENYYFNLAIGASFIFAYYALSEYYWKGKTVGKFTTQTTVKNITGKSVSLRSILWRSVLRLIPLEPITFLFGKERGWHDDFSGTMVVED